MYSSSDDRIGDRLRRKATMRPPYCRARARVSVRNALADYYTEV